MQIKMKLGACAAVMLTATAARAEEDPGVIESAFISAFWYIVNVILGVAMKMMDWLTKALGDKFPEGTGSFISQIIDILNNMNYWIPIDFGVTLLTTYAAMWIIATIYQNVIKFIPSIGAH